LPEKAGGFEKGQRPGENAIDTKTMPKGARPVLLVRNCYFHGWKQPAQISNAAALNIKENVHAKIENCVLRDNEIAFRLRGPGKRGGALVEITNCAIYDSAFGVRMEDKVCDLKIDKLVFGGKVTRKYRPVSGGAGPGYRNTGEHVAPALEDALKNG